MGTETLDHRSEKMEVHWPFVPIVVEIMHSMDNLKKLPKMGELSQEAMTAFWAYGTAALADGAIPTKYKELMAITVALTT